MTQVFCIDFGTAETRVLAVGGSFPAPRDVAVVPSMALFEAEGRITSGEAAQLMAGALDDLVGASLKRMIGRSASDGRVTQICAARGYRASSDAAGALVLESKTRKGKVTDGVEAIIAGALESDGPGRYHAALVIPAWFDEKQVGALFACVRRTGAASVAMVSDVAASLLWHAHATNIQGRVLVVDIGAGGIGALLADVHGKTVRVLASRGSDRYAGDDIDAELAHAAIDAAPDDFELVRQACQAMKRELADTDSAKRELMLSGRDDPSEISAQRWELELLLAKLGAAATEVIGEAIDEAGVDRKSITQLILAGGMTRDQAVARSLAKTVDKEPSRVADESCAVVLGAALHVLGQREPKSDTLPQLLITPARASTPGEPKAAPPAPAERAQPQAPAPLVRTPIRYRPEVVRRRVEPARRTLQPPPMPSSGANPSGGSLPPPPLAPRSAGGLGSATSSSGAPRASIIPPTPVTRPLATGVGSIPPPPPPNSPHTPPMPPSPTVSASMVPPPISAGSHSGLSMAPPAMPTGLSRREGAIVNPFDAAGILAMAISRPMTAADYEPIALPVLCRRVLARKDRFGTLIVALEGEELSIDVAGGAANLDRHELAALMTAFDHRHGRYRILQERRAGDRREPIPLARIALDGVRKLLRQPSIDDLERSFVERMELAPRIKADRAVTIRRMGLSQRELRFVDSYLDGVASCDHVATHGGMGRHTVLQLLAVLELFEIIEWTEAERVDPSNDLRDLLHGEIHRILQANHFEALGVHWSAGDGDLQAAFITRRDRFAVGSDADRLDPEGCRQVRAKLETAFEQLRTPKQRAAYRRVAFKGQDFDAVADLEQKRSESLAMRGDVRAAVQSEAVAKELARSIDEQRALELQRRAHRPNIGGPKKQ